MHDIIDFHTHAFPDKVAPLALNKLGEQARLANPMPSHDGTAAGLLRSMDAAGIKKSVICSIATSPGQFQPIVDWSLTLNSQRLMPFASVHPFSDEVEKQLKTVKSLGFMGIKLHPQHQGFDVIDSSLDKFWQRLQKSELVLVIHCGLDFAFDEYETRSHPDKIRQLHKAYPDIPIVATHMGGWKQWECSLDLLAGTEVYFDTSFSVGLAPDKLMLDLFEKHPCERILFGSDSPWVDQKASVKALKKLIPPEDESFLSAILYDNAVKLLTRT